MVKIRKETKNEKDNESDCWHIVTVIIGICTK